MRQGAQGWCTGMTLRDGMGREVGGRVRIGNTCIPMADSCECMAKTTTSNYNLKKKSVWKEINSIIWGTTPEAEVSGYRLSETGPTFPWEGLCPNPAPCGLGALVPLVLRSQSLQQLLRAHILRQVLDSMHAMQAAWNTILSVHSG